MRLGVSTFSPDGTQILTGSFDGIVQPWRADLQDVIRLASAQLPRDLSDEERRWRVHESRQATAHDGMLKNRQVTGRASGVRCEPMLGQGLIDDGADACMRRGTRAGREDSCVVSAQPAIGSVARTL